MNIFTCASVSLFDINDHKERKISRKKDKPVYERNIQRYCD